MRVDRFREYLREKLAGHPEVASVELYDAPGGGQQDLRVTFVDGTSMDLRTVRTSPPGGDPHSQPEKIVTKTANV